MRASFVLRKGGKMFIKREIRNALACDKAKDLSPRQFYNLIMTAIEPEMPMLAHAGERPLEIIPSLDYGGKDYGARWEKLSDIPDIENYFFVNAVPCPGSSEGVYLDVSLMTRNGLEQTETRTPLFTFKTLSEGPDGYAAMGALGGMVQYAVELFLMIHF